MAGTEPTESKPMGSGPSQISDPKIRHEAQKALAWTLVVGGVALAVYLAQSLLIIAGGVIFAAMIDGGARLIARWLPIGRRWCVAIVLILTLLFLVWLGYFAGSQISQQAAQFPALVTDQINTLVKWLQNRGFAIESVELQSLFNNFATGIGTVTRAIGGLFGGLTTFVLILVIGLFVALEPDLYERGVAWMLPQKNREEFMVTASRMGRTLRHLLAGRLVGMVIEGVFTWAMLALYGVPMAALLGLLTGLLAFIPNIGALISGALMVLVGFSGGTDMGLYTVFVYFFVQTIDGYVLIPLIAKKTVDLAPALVLGAQLIMGVLFGILGLALADPLLAMLKVALERRAERYDAAAAAKAVEG